MQSKLRASDLLARIGGDEFAIILTSCDIKKVKHIAQSIVTSVAEYQFNWEGNHYKIGVSIGITPISDDSRNLKEVLNHADCACYEAKNVGRNQFKIN